MEGTEASESAKAAARASSGSARVMTGMLGSRVLGLVREQLLAATAGAGATADVVFVALRTPNMIQNLLGEQALSASFIPIYSRWLEQGRNVEARRFAGAVLALLLVVTVALALGGVLVAPLLVSVFASGFLDDPEKFSATVAAVRFTVPMTAVLVLSAWCLAILNSHRRFFLPYFAPVLWNLSIVAGLVWLGWRVEDPSMRRFAVTVAIAALVGGLLQFLVQLPTTLKVAGEIRLSLDLETPGVRPALRAFGPAVLGRGVVQASSSIEQWLASFLSAGAVSAINWAVRLYMLPVGLFGTAFSVVELPELSRLDPETGARRVRQRLRRALATMGFLTVPSSVGFVVLGLPIVRAVYERFEFGLADSWLVYLILACYSLGLVASTSSRLLQNAFFAGRDTRTPATYSGVRLLVTVSVGAASMLWLDRLELVALVPIEDGNGLRLGAIGLALGSALGSWVELLVLQRALGRRQSGELAVDRVGMPWSRLSRLLGVAAVAALGSGAAWWGLAGRHPLLQMPVIVAIFAAIYLGMAAALRLEESSALWNQVRGLTRRR